MAAFFTKDTNIYIPCASIDKSEMMPKSEMMGADVYFTVFKECENGFFDFRSITEGARPKYSVYSAHSSQTVVSRILEVDILKG